MWAPGNLPETVRETLRDLRRAIVGRTLDGPKMQNIPHFWSLAAQEAIHPSLLRYAPQLWSLAGPEWGMDHVALRCTHACVT